MKKIRYEGTGIVRRIDELGRIDKSKPELIRVLITLIKKIIYIVYVLKIKKQRFYIQTNECLLESVM